MSDTPKAFGHGVKQRDVVRMTTEEIRAFLAPARTMAMCTLAADGSIHAVAMWYGLLDAGPGLPTIGFESKAKAQKIVNLRRNPTITCLVEAGDRYEELQGVSITGTAEVVDDRDVLRAIGRSIVDRYPVPASGDVEAVLDAMLRNRVGVLVRPSKVLSWDHRKLGLGGAGSVG